MMLSTAKNSTWVPKAWKEMQLACENGEFEELDLCLLRYEGDINLILDERCMDTLLHLACKAGSPECVTLLLNRQAEINVKNVDWDTPLHLAAKSSSECVQILLAAGAKPCEMNRFLNKPLHVAVKEGSFQSVKLLVDNISRNLAYNLEAEVNTKNLNKRTPLHFAAQIGSAECVKLLVENKSVLWLKDDVGNVPLHYAAMSKSSECVKLLIKSGANLVSVNKDRNTALSLIVDKMRDGEDLLIKVLDSCIHIDYSNEELKLDLTVLCPVAEDNKMAVANRLYSSHWRKSKLLLHPLLKTLIRLEWNKTRHIIWYRFTSYIFYLLALTLYVCLPPSSVFSLVARIVVGFLSGHVILFCFPYLFPGQYSWTRRITKTLLTIVPPILSLVTISVSYNAEWCGIAFLLSWLSIPLYTNAIAVISEQAGMFRYVIREIAKHSLIFIFVILGFSIAFFVLYHEKSAEGFRTSWQAFLFTCLVLLQGESLGDYPIFGETNNSTFLKRRNFTYVTEALSNMRFASILVSLLFVFVVIIALLNMLVALAVRGGDELQSYGLVYHLWGQAQLLYEWNEVKRILRKCKKNSEQSHDYECITIKENQISMSLRHELYAAAKDKEEDNVLTVKEAKEIMKQNMEELLHEIKELRRTIAELQDEDRYET
ncbi:transient receptor potential channel pyrexia-like isoform X2 [Periplaneta americana]|uniref:transient receptor potential channel pyrexia-like isoform X2 n=1 Tax=Periplaneta americana TaxID=6978 RepID=UPI0037E9B6BE